MATSEVLSVIATITSVKGNNSDFTSRVAAFKVLTKNSNTIQEELRCFKKAENPLCSLPLRL